MASASVTYRRDIDGLRAVAVLAVLLFHLDIPGVTGGFTGVDIFFVISGYLITGLIRRGVEAGSFSLLEFYSRRLRRLFPAMFVTVVATFVIGALLMSPVTFRSLASSALAASLSVSNFLFWLQSGYFDPSKWTKPLLHTWSLGVEEQFYLLWPATIILLLALRKRLSPLAAVLAVSAVSLALAETVVQYRAAAAFYLLPFRVFEFGLGAALVWLPAAERLPRFARESGFAAGLAMIAGAVLLFDSDTRFPGVTALLPCAGAALSIYFGQTKLAQTIFANSPAVFVGKISYSLYLTHWPIIVFAKYYLLRDLTAAETLAAFAASVATALLLYLYVERPFRFQEARNNYVAPRKVMTWTAACLLLLAVPLVSAAFGGWAWRIKDGSIFADRTWLHYTYYGGLKCTGMRCETTGNPAQPKVFVLGDSHARSLHAGLQRAFPGINFVIFASGNCSYFSFSARYYTVKRHSTDCPEERAAAFQEILTTQAPVIIFNYWRWQSLSRYLSRDRNSPVFHAHGIADFASFVASELELLHSKLGDRKIFVIGGVPEFATIGSPLDCISRPLQNPPCATSPRNSKSSTSHSMRPSEISRTSILSGSIRLIIFAMIASAGI